MAKKEVKKEKSKVKPTKNNELAAKILSVMKALRGNGVTEVTSTILKDKLQTKSRAPIRRAMKLLAKAGTVVMDERKHGKRKQYVYRLP